MYSAGNAQPGSGVARTSLPVIAAICCGATLLLLLAATIVLALIPLYVPNKTLTKASTTSGKSTVYLPMSDSARKRDQGKGIADAAGYSVTETESLTEIQEQLFGVLSTTGYAKSVAVESCSVVLLSSKRRRRDGISKRQSTQPFLKCLFRVVFVDKCASSSCQTTAGGLMVSKFKTDSEVKKFRLTKLYIWINGIKYRFPCSGKGAARINGIGPEGNIPDDSQSPVTPTTTALTTLSTTAALTG